MGHLNYLTSVRSLLHLLLPFVQHDASRGARLVAHPTASSPRRPRRKWSAARASTREDIGHSELTNDTSANRRSKRQSATSGEPSAPRCLASAWHRQKRSFAMRATREGRCGKHSGFSLKSPRPIGRTPSSRPYRHNQWLRLDSPTYHPPSSSSWQRQRSHIMTCSTITRTFYWEKESKHSQTRTQRREDLLYQHRSSRSSEMAKVGWRPRICVTASCFATF